MAGIYNGPARGGTRGGKDQVAAQTAAAAATRPTRHVRPRVHAMPVVIVRATAVRLGGRQGRQAGPELPGALRQGGSRPVQRADQCAFVLASPARSC